MANTHLLTRGRTRTFIRMAGIISLMLATGGILLLLAPVEKPLSPRDVAQASVRYQNFNDLLFPKFSDLVSGRHTPFEFEQLELAQVQLQQPLQQTEPEPESEAPPPPPAKPKPDINGLALVGTAPGSQRAFALFKDEQSGEILTLARGEQIRGSEIREIHPDRIVLALADETAEIALPEVTPGNPANAAPVTPVQQQTFIASANTANRTVVAANTGTAGASDGTSQNSGAANDNSSQNNNASADSNASGSGNSSSSASGSSGKRPSLGISGHMLSFDKQQELGLEQTGLLVTAVRRSDIDVQVNDVVLAIDGQTFSSTREALAIIRKAQSGSVQLSVFRGGSQISISVALT